MRSKQRETVINGIDVRKIIMENNRRRRRKAIIRLALLAVLVLAVFGVLTAANVGPGQDISRMLGLRTTTVTSHHDPSAANKKTETVYVDTAAGGRAQSVNVDVTLKNNREENRIQDTSILKNIDNYAGDETFRRDKKDNALIWETPDGQDVKYQGTTTARNLPVTMHVTYTLNGQKISGSDLQGKSGRVKITIRYTGKLTELVDGKKTRVPAVCLTTLLVRDGSLKNIRISNGETIRQDDYSVCMGVCAPGLAGAIGSDILKGVNDDQIVITGNADNFDGQEIMTVVDTDVVKVVSNKQLNKLNKDKQIRQLKKSSRKLVKASRQLYKATAAVSNGVKNSAKTSTQLAEDSTKMTQTMNEKMGKMQELGRTVPEQGNKARALSQLLHGETRLLQDVHNDSGDGSLDTAMNSLDQAGQEIAAIEDDYDYDKLAEYLNHSDYTGSQLSDDDIAALKDILKVRETADKAKEHQESAADDVKKAQEQVSDARLLHDGADTSEEEARFRLVASQYSFDPALVQQEDGSYEGMDDQAGDLQTAFEDLDRAFSDLTLDGEKINTTARTLSSDLRKLNQGQLELNQKTRTMRQRSKKLSGSMKKYYRHAVSRLVTGYNKTLKGTAARMKRLKKAGELYDNYSGLSTDMDGDVTFIYFTPMGDK